MGMKSGQTDTQNNLKVRSSLVQGRADGRTDRQTDTECLVGLKAAHGNVLEWTEQMCTWECFGVDRPRDGRMDSLHVFVGVDLYVSPIQSSLIRQTDGLVCMMHQQMFFVLSANVRTAQTLQVQGLAESPQKDSLAYHCTVG